MQNGIPSEVLENRSDVISVTFGEEDAMGVIQDKRAVGRRGRSERLIFVGPICCSALGQRSFKISFVVILINGVPWVVLIILLDTRELMIIKEIVPDQFLIINWEDIF